MGQQIEVKHKARGVMPGDNMTKFGLKSKCVLQYTLHYINHVESTVLALSYRVAAQRH